MTATTRKFLAGSVIAISSVIFVGCAHENHEIPESARMLNDASGSITVSAPSNGTVYVYDKTDNNLVYSGKIDKNDVLHLNSDSHNIYINGQKVASGVLIGDHDRQVFFEPAPGPTVIQSGDTTYVEPEGHTTVVTPDDEHTTVVKPNDHNETVITSPSD